MADLKEASSHFAFGKNWGSYATLIDRARIEGAKQGLLRLIPAEDFRERSFLDIGCGSGLHALAASELGAARILAVDLDRNSVATTQAVLTNQDITTPWTAAALSVFALDPARLGTFDIVYSWGVLHHTGSMWEAVENAAAMVAPKGLLAIALYRRTRFDPFWKIEKRLYAHAPAVVQKIIRACYIAAFSLGLLATGRTLSGYAANYRERGMDFYHDVHDWLGGYPYESALASEVDAKLASLGFKAERVFAKPMGLGLFGSACDEFVYRRKA